MDNFINMALTKNQLEILKVFVSNITQRFSMRQIAKILNKDPSQVHRAIKPIIKRGILDLTPEKKLLLNYRENHQILAYVEFLREEMFFEKQSNKVIKLFIDDVLKGLKDTYLIIVLFGSAVESKKPRDLDLLFIVESTDRVDSVERFLFNKSENYTCKFDINVIATSSVYEMGAKREEANILNEVLNKHLILFGGEYFYRLVKNARHEKVDLYTLHPHRNI